MRATVPPPLVSRTLAPPRARWNWNLYLAVLAVPVLVWQVWTYVAWLADGPEVISEFRETSTVNWYAAHILEALSVGIAIPVAIHVIRRCIRERRFTFDAMFCLCGATMTWGDIGSNFFQPVFLVSSNFINVANMCGHIPLVVNPDCGRVPDPILLFFPLEVFGLLGIAIAAEGPIRWARNRWPGISNAKVFGLLLLAGLLIDVVFEFVCIALGLWSYVSHSAISVPLGKSLRYPLTELLAGAVFFAWPVAIRAFRDDSGRNFFERGLQHLRPRRQRLVSLLSLYFVFQFMLWIPVSMPDMLYGPWMKAWPELPNYLVNDVCDAPGIHGTRYGLCPGSPGYGVPLPGYLPGESP